MTENGNGNGNGHRLTLKQRRFVDELFECGFNATEAARRSGYGSPRQRGYDNVTNRYILAEIDRRFAAQGLTSDEIVWRFQQMVNVTMDDFVDIDERGNFYLNLNKAKERGVLGAVKRFGHNAKGYPQIELYDKQHALTQLAKMHGLIQERLHVVTEQQVSERELYRFEDALKD